MHPRARTTTVAVGALLAIPFALLLAAAVGMTVLVGLDGGEQQTAACGLHRRVRPCSSYRERRVTSGSPRTSMTGESGDRRSGGPPGTGLRCPGRHPHHLRGGGHRGAGRSGGWLRSVDRDRPPGRRAARLHRLRAHMGRRGRRLRGRAGTHRPAHRPGRQQRPIHRAAPALRSMGGRAFAWGPCQGRAVDPMRKGGAFRQLGGPLSRVLPGWLGASFTHSRKG
jgi:hypothetical protein